MTTAIRPAAEADLPALTALCLRSKAAWGYDAAFIAACRDELTLRPEDLRTTSVAVAARAGAPEAMAQVGAEGEAGELLKLYVDPGSLRSGLGRLLFAWAAEEARRLGVRRLMIESDPNAAAFYLRMGARQVGDAPSGSIPGRRLPLFALAL